MHKHQHQHQHEHAHTFSKLDFIFFILALLCFGLGFVPIAPFTPLLFFGLCIILSGYEMLFHGCLELLHLKLRENALMAIAVVAAFALGEYSEACMVVLLFKIGEFLEQLAMDRSKKSFESLSAIQPETARVIVQNGKEQIKTAKEVQVGEQIRLLPGDRVPLNCKVLEGTSSVNTAALTGESSPVYAEVGSRLWSGALNGEGVLLCEVTHTLENSAASQIIQMVYESSKKKGETEKFMTRFAKVYTPIVVICGVLLAALPPLFGWLPFEESLSRSLIFLVAACPCALVISVPLSFFSAIGALSKRGILVKGTKYVETLSNLSCVAFDKTGTLTDGNLTVDRFVVQPGFHRQTLLCYARTVEQHSTHPLSRAILNYAKDAPMIDGIKTVKEYAGLGLAAQLDGQKVLCGNRKFLEKEQIKVTVDASCYLCIDGNVAAYLYTKEAIPVENCSIAASLKQCGVQLVAMLTGDNQSAADAVAKQCGVDRVYASLMPEGKVEKMEQLKAVASPVAFVGDGINDAPVLASADIGISMGLGSQAANASSDVVLVENHLSKLPEAIVLARRGMRVVRFNIVFALMVKCIVILLCALGLAPMWLGVLADTGVTIFAILNALRIFSFFPKTDG